MQQARRGLGVRGSTPPAIRSIVAVVFVLLAQPAQAAESDKTAAKAHYEAGTRLYDIKEWAKALDEYKAAYLSKPDPAFLFNIGQCYRKLGKQAQALEFYKEYLKKAPPDDPNRPNVEARVRELEAGDVFEADGAQKSVPPPVQPSASPPPMEPGPGAKVEAESAGTVLEPNPPAAVAPTAPAPAPLPPTLSAEAPRPSLEFSTVEYVGPPPTPFYKTWWFWTGVGVAVVGGTAAVVAASSGGKHGNTADTALGTQAVFQ